MNIIEVFFFFCCFLANIITFRDFFSLRLISDWNDNIDSCNIFPLLKTTCANDTQPDALPPVDNLLVLLSLSDILDSELFFL